MFRYCNGKIPDIIQNIFMINYDIHDHYTRQGGSYHVPKVKNNLGKWSIRYRGVIVWNTILSLKINPETSEALFAKNVKKCIMNQSPSLWLFYICWYQLRFLIFHRTNVYGTLSISHRTMTPKSVTPTAPSCIDYSGTPSTTIYTRWSSRCYGLGCHGPMVFPFG